MINILFIFMERLVYGIGQLHKPSNLYYLYCLHTVWIKCLIYKISFGVFREIGRPSDIFIKMNSSDAL